MNFSSSSKGFTLLELLIVIAVIGILATVLVPNLVQARNKAHDRASTVFIRLVISGIESKRDIGSQSLPTTPATCFPYADLSANPTSIKRCKYEPDLSRDVYTITVESMSGEILQFDGTSIVAVASY
jgi:type IV pilus assembly protein PilA